MRSDIFSSRNCNIHYSLVIFFQIRSSGSQTNWILRRYVFLTLFIFKHFSICAWNFHKYIFETEGTNVVDIERIAKRKFHPEVHQGECKVNHTMQMRKASLCKLTSVFPIHVNKLNIVLHE